MSSTSGTPYYTSRSMNGINQISVINENITDLENKTQDITYNDLTQTTTIVNNTQLYNATINTSLTTTNLKLTDNSIDMSNNGTYTFIDDGLSGQVVDTTHNQTIGGFKTFTGGVDINTLVIDSTTYPDGSTQTSANYLTPIQVNATDRITATNSMQTDQFTANDIFCQTINISDKIIDANDTGYAPNAFIYNSTTMCYRNPIVNNTPLAVAVGQYVKSNGIGLQPTGDTGVTIASINTTNQSMTFSAGGFSLSIPPAILTQSLSAIISTNQFISYNSLSILPGFGIRGTGTSANQPFVSSVTALYTATTPTASLTTTITTKAGYINSNNRLVSLDTYPNQNFINMTGVSNPSYISSTFATNEYTITSRNTITPNATTGSFSAIPLNSTQLLYNTFAGASTDFITQLNNISAGTKSTNNTTTGTLTLSLSHTPPTTTTIIVSGYVLQNTLKLETITALGRYVTGTGTNGIPTNINSFISAVPTAPSSTYTIRSGLGTLSPTNTSSTLIEGYIRFTSPNYFFISTTQLTDNDFIETIGTTAIPQATRTRTPIAPYAGQSNIMRLTQLNGYNPTATTTTFILNGIITSSTTISMTLDPVGLAGGYMIENATSIPSSFNSLIPNGTKTTNYLSSTQTLFATGLTPSSPTLTGLTGYMRTSSILEIRGLGNSTPRLNWFFTGSGIGANKNYVSVATSQSPFTLASTNTATTPVGSALPGYTRFNNSSSFYLVLANTTPFVSNNYLISSTSLPENTGLSGSLSGINNGILVNADFSTYTTANVSVREPTIAVNPLGYKAYPVSSTTYYVLETITLGATNYIETTKINGTSGFAGILTTRGTPNANNLFTTTATIGSTTITSSVTGAIYNGGASGWYYCSQSLNNNQENFIVGTTIAPQTSVIYNSNTFDKGSNNLSKLSFRTAPVASTIFTTNNLAYIIKSNSTAPGSQYVTSIWCKFATTRIAMANDKFFINGGFANSVLNGAYVSFFYQPPTLLGFSAELTGNNFATATPEKGTSATFGLANVISPTQFICNCVGFTPAVGDFVQIISSFGIDTINYVTAVTAGVAPAFTITIAYSGGFTNSTTATFITPVNTNSSLLNPTTSMTAYESQNLVVYTAGSTFSYYNSGLTYSAYSPLTINIYDGLVNIPYSIPPVQYTIQTPFTYNYITPLSITDYGRTTLSFYNPENITFYTFFDINLPPNSGTTTLVSVDAIQTLTNKTLTTNTTLTSPTITTPTINTITLQTSTGQTSSQLGYRISNKLPGNTIVTANTWTQPSGSLGLITLPGAGVWLLTYSFTTRTGGNVLMGALTLVNNLNTIYTAPQTTNVNSNVFAFSAQTSPNGNYITCSATYIYVATGSTPIYLWWAGSLGNTIIQGEGGYFQAVRIA